MTSLPDHHQQEDVGYVFDVLKAGESCSLVGIGSIGKSNLLRYIARDHIKKQYLGRDAPFYITVFLDPHQIIHLENDALAMAGSYWPGYELLLSRLHRVLWDMQYAGHIAPPDNGADSIIKLTHDYYLKLFGNDVLPTQAGIRHFEYAVYEVLQQNPRRRLAFLFDDIEAFLDCLPPEFFQSLRGVRDDFKQRVMFVTGSRHALGEVVEKLAADRQDPGLAGDLEGFIELFHQFTRYIGPLSYASTVSAVEVFAVRYRLSLEPGFKDNLIRALFKITGGHAGLLRRCILPIIPIRDSLGEAAAEDYPGEYVLDYLLRDAGVLKECRIILDSLAPDELVVLRQIVNQEPVADSHAYKTLRDKHLIGSTETGMPAITIPLVQRYLFWNLLPG